MLRDLTSDDLQTIYEQQLDMASHLQAAFGPGGPRSWDDFQAHWSKVLADDACAKQVILDDAGQIVGNIGAFWMEGEHEVGYWIAQEHRGRGHAKKALEEFLELLPERPLHARVVKDNAPSIKVLEGAGFTRVGEDKGLSKARQEEVEEWIYMLA